MDAVAKRLKQLGSDEAPVRRAQIFGYKRLGELLPPAQRGNPSGTNQHTGAISQHREIAQKSAGEMNRDWLSRKINENWEKVEPLLPKMKKPSVKGVKSEVHDFTSPKPQALKDRDWLSRTHGVHPSGNISGRGVETRDGFPECDRRNSDERMGPTP